MSGNRAAQWPRFELATFAKPTSIPDGWDEDLILHGAPKAFLGRYESSPALTLVTVSQSQQWVCFGHTAEGDLMCLDPFTRQIVCVINVPNGPSFLVNTSLDQFIQTVRAVIERFPFYTGGSSLAVREEVGREIAQIVSRIDPAAISNVDGYWQTFIDDLVIGDLATENVVSERP